MEKYSIEVDNFEYRKSRGQKAIFLNIANCCDIFNSRWLGDYVISIPDLRSVICCESITTVDYLP
jgi:hypothetical protein